MSSCGVDLTFLRKTKETHTGQAIIMLNQSGQNSIVIVGGANTHYHNLTVLPEEFKQAIDNSRFILLQKEIPIELTTLAAQYAKSKNKIVMLDCGGRDEQISDALLKNLDFISPNETELARLMNSKSANITTEEIRNSLLAKYPNLIVVLKLGENGSAILTKQTRIDVTSAGKLNPKIMQDHKIVDTTGAGDCFTSAFCVKLNEMWSKSQNVHDVPEAVF